MWHRDLMWHYKMRYIMKQVFLVILLVFGFVAGAQNVTVRKPKKQKSATTQVAPKKHKSQSKPTKGGTVKRVATKASYSNGTLTVNGIKYNMVWVEGGDGHQSKLFQREQSASGVCFVERLPKVYPQAERPYWSALPLAHRG